MTNIGKQTTIEKSQNKLTLAKKCYDSFKKKYPEGILFFRMGEFYESFFEDSKICSQISGRPLTFRDKPEIGQFPLFSVPFHALDSFVKKIIKAGHKVVICEQCGEKDYLKIIKAGDL